MSNEDSKTLMDEILMSGKKKIHSISNSEIEKADEFCEPYKDFLNKSRTEREAVVEAVAQAKENGFEEYDPDRTYSAGDKIYIVNRNKAVGLAVIGRKGTRDGVLLSIAHIASPRIDLKPSPLYEKDGMAHTNEERGIKRKLSSLRSFYKYLYKNEFIQSNPASKVSTPKIHDKNIIRLDADEVANLLDEVESGENLTKKQQMFHDRTKVRDLALLTLMLGTGIRVSECVGLDLDDVDLKNNGIKIHRKGGAEVVVYFGEEVRNALCGYMEERKLITPVSGDENALFLSMQKRRIGVRAVENLVKKYAKLVTNLKNITPHKLRSTYGTSLYRETGDIYLVADVLGHKDVNTTKKHYAAIEEDRRRSAAKYVHLRED